MSKRRLNYDDYKLGWVCALPIELAAAEQLLEERHSDLPRVGADDNLYALGCIAGHSVVIASLPEGQMGNVSAATAAVQMNSTFKCCRFTLLVGIGGGVPSQDHDVRLGDVVVQKPVNDHGGVLQYDMGKVTPTGNIRTGSLTSPPRVLLNALAKVQANIILGRATTAATLLKLGADIPVFSRTNAGVDALYQGSYNHPGGRTCQDCDDTKVVPRSDRPQTNGSSIVVHYGAIASGNRVMKDAATRDSISKELGGVLCFEMEAAGLATSMSCLVIRGISDYADSHKNDAWQPYAAAAAAAFAKEILTVVPPVEVATTVGGESAATRAESHIVKWLSPLNFFVTHHDIFSRHVSDTGKELLESNKFISWSSTPGSGLWCQGSPGVGKTIQASVVVQYLFERCKQNSGMGVASIYFNYKEQSDQKADNVLAAIWMQLAYNSPISQFVQSLYAEHEAKGTRPSTQETINALADALTLYDQVFIVIDAIDESAELVGSQVLQALRGLGTKVNIMVTSRNAKGTLAFVDQFQDVELRASARDVEVYVSSRIDSEPSLHSLLAGEASLRQIISEAISARAAGIFLLARLHVDTLSRQDSIRGIRHALGALSGDLWTVFDQLMERIQAQVSARKSRAQQLLAWTLCATRPLQLEEVRAALGVELDDTDADPEALPNMDHALSTCAGILAVDQESQLVRFLHYTFHQYLADRGFSFQGRNPQIYLSRVCLTYVCYSQLETGYCNSDADMDARLTAYPLLRYSSENWGVHARGGVEAEQDVQNHILKFLSRAGNVNAALQVMSLPENNFEGYSQTRPRHAPDIWMAARFGLLDICRRLISSGCDVNQLAADKTTALIESSKQGHAVIARLLLQHDAQAALLSLDDRSALHEAAIRGNITIAQVLIRGGLFVDTAPRSGRTPLHDAVSAGKLAMVDFLLTKRADPSSRTAESHWTVLHSAASAGNAAIVRSLCEAHADCNAKTSFGQTPLLIAAEHGQDAVIECLLDHGADMEACDLGGNRAIHIAARQGHGSSMLLLQRRGADTVSGNIHGDTLLHTAASSGHVHILNLLLGSQSSSQVSSEAARTDCPNHGTDSTAASIDRPYINSSNKNGQTPLHVASVKGHGAVVSLLLQAGAIVNETCCSPLHARITRSQQDILALRSLLDYEEVFTALDIAVSCGHVDLINVLERAGGQRLHVTSGVKDRLERQIEATAQTLLPGSQRRMKKEINAMLTHISEKPFSNNNPCRYTAFVPVDGNLCSLAGVVFGPENTVYEGGVFLVDIQIPRDFPFKPPKVNFTTKIYHPFVNEGNRLSMYFLQDQMGISSGGWSPAFTLTRVMQMLHESLAQPAFANEFSNDYFAAARMVQQNKARFYEKARQWTLEFAF